METKKRGPNRPYPHHTLDEALLVAQKIRDEKAGRPMNRLLLADALGIKPASSDFKAILSSSLKYGLTEGTEKASEIKLTDLGVAATGDNAVARLAAKRSAVMAPKVFGKFYESYNQAKVPTMIEKVLVADFEVPLEHATECAHMLNANGTLVGIIRDISGSPHVLLDDDPLNIVVDGDNDQPSGANRVVRPDEPTDEGLPPSARSTESAGAPPKPIFLGHGKNHKPLEKLEKMLAGFQIPYRVVVDEPNLGRPIPAKVKETMVQCGSAILIFTRDERFVDADGQEIWRPSENVAHELGAASYAFEDRIVIFKEKGITLPTNFSSVGYIEFEPENIEAKTMELLQELIGFGLVKITTA